MGSFSCRDECIQYPSISMSICGLKTEKMIKINGIINYSYIPQGEDETPMNHCKPRVEDVVIYLLGVQFCHITNGN